MKIGFIDYYMSEWHSNNYPAWIKEQAALLGIECEVAYAWAEDDVSPRDNMTTDEWCEKFGTKRCDSIKELCELSDFVFILAPADPDKHLPYAREAFKYSKRLYIDKTFAPNPAEAEEIFALAKENGAEFFSTSALRYASELDDYKGVKSLITTGNGRTLSEYIIHQAEMIVKVLGTGAKSVVCEQNDDVSVLTISYGDDRSAVMNYSTKLGFSVESDGKKTAISSPFFKALIADIIRFANGGEKSFCSCETIEAIKIRSAAVEAYENPGKVVSI